MLFLGWVGGCVFWRTATRPKSDSIPIGVYFLRPDVFDVIAHLAPSGRGEFEITDVLNHYVGYGGLYTRHYAGSWHDAGTIDSLLEASTLVSRTSAVASGPPEVRPA